MKTDTTGIRMTRLTTLVAAAAILGLTLAGTAQATATTASGSYRSGATGGQVERQVQRVLQVKEQIQSDQNLLERLRSLYPATTFKSVGATPWPGVFEVSMGANLAYVDATGRHFLFGHLYDMREQRDLTAERRQALSRIDVQALPLADAITEVRGNGSRFLAIFSDPDCPYCKRLEVDLQDLTDVTVHTFVMPLASLHPQARDKAVRVWCNSSPEGSPPAKTSQLNASRVQAWHRLMRSTASQAEPMPVATPQDSTADRVECDHPIDRNVALGQSLGIHGTPTLVAGDGRILQGASGREQVDAWLSPAASTSTRDAGTQPTTYPAAAPRKSTSRKAQP